MLVGGIGWYMFARLHPTFYILTLSVYVMTVAAFGAWAHGNDVIIGWPKKRPPGE